MRRVPKFSAIAFAASMVAASCASDPSSDPPPAEQPDDYEQDVDRGCARIFHQDVFPEYRVAISASEWAALEQEFWFRVERESAGLDPHPYHPVVFEYEGELVTDAMIRLKGQSSWLQAIQFDDEPKMQFIIAFNKLNRDGRFMGVRKLELDMPRNDASFLRQRLALYFLRAAGIDAQCANNARLVINGEYYGLYTNLERLDKEFLQRVYGDDDDGDLWKGARYIQTNEETFSWERLEAFWDATDAAQLAAIVDLEASVAEWAAEAMAPDGDGYYNGRANFFLYDHPSRGFVWLPHDLDAAFDYSPADLSPLYPEGAGRWPHDREHWSMVLSVPEWEAAYEAELRRARAAYLAHALVRRVDEWAAQIAEAAKYDPMRPFTFQTHTAAVAALRAYPVARAAAVDDWLACRSNGGRDQDGDGFDACHDCDDGDARVYPGAAELCNGVDDNCDGRVDELSEDVTCE